MKLGKVVVAAGLAGALTFFVGACGDDNDDNGAASTTTAAAANTPPDVKAAVDAWAKADSPETVCALMTYGFKVGVAKGKDPAQCASWIVSALGQPTASAATIVSTSSVQGQTAVSVRFSGDASPTTLYLVQECGALKVNSIGELHANPPAPPSC
jgi:hypothetical protein